MRAPGPPLPAGSLLWQLYQPGDFLDHRSCPSGLTPREAAERLVRFPAWVRGLMLLRTAAVAPFGLRTTVPQGMPAVGLFPIADDRPGELILGFDDRHLDFRISVLSDAGRIHVSTWVRPRNAGGRLYLAAVLPFHVLILCDAMARLTDGHAPGQGSGPACQSRT